MRWAVIVALSLTACGRTPETDTDGPAARGSVALRDFTGVALESGDELSITQGPAFAVVVEGGAAARDRMDIRRDGDMLKIGRKDRHFFSGGGEAVRVRVTMPALQSAVLAGSGDIAIDRAADGFAGTLSGSGDMTIGQLRGESAALTVAGTGTIAAAGAVRRITLSVAGTGDIDARQVRAGEATVSIAGTGNVVADINGPAQVSLVGTGSATLGSDARCVVNRVGTGNVSCG